MTFFFFSRFTGSLAAQFTHVEDEGLLDADDFIPHLPGTASVLYVRNVTHGANFLTLRGGIRAA